MPSSSNVYSNVYVPSSLLVGVSCSLLSLSHISHISKSTSSASGTASSPYVTYASSSIDSPTSAVSDKSKSTSNMSSSSSSVVSSVSPHAARTIAVNIAATITKHLRNILSSSEDIIIYKMLYDYNKPFSSKVIISSNNVSIVFFSIPLYPFTMFPSGSTRKNRTS